MKDPNNLEVHIEKTETKIIFEEQIECYICKRDMEKKDAFVNKKGLYYCRNTPCYEINTEFN
jgi:hypothetical protein